MFNWYKKNNKFKATDIGYIPQPGDLIFFDWKGNKTGKDQVGIVEFTGGNTIQVIEAAFRQYALQPPEDGVNVLIAAARYLAAHAPTMRSQGQTYQMAERLHRGDRVFEDS